MRGLNDLRHKGAFPVGANNQPGARFIRPVPAFYASPDAANPAFLDNELLDQPILAQLRPGLHRGIDQDRIQHGPPRADDGVHAFVFRVIAVNHRFPKLEASLGRRGTVRSQHRIQQSPAPEGCRPFELDLVCGECIAREMSPVDQ